VQALGQCCLQFCHVLLGGSDYRQRRFVADPKHVDHCRPLAIECGSPVVLLKAVFHGRDVADAHLRPVGWAQQHDVAELVAPVASLGGAKQDLARCGLDGSSRELDRCGPDARSDFVERQMVLAKLCLWDLDADL